MEKKSQQDFLYLHLFYCLCYLFSELFGPICSLSPFLFKCLVFLMTQI